eukprot:m.106167 g.106167  ORF g.106167 m.106167 type:complete len:772 (+) comp8940_c0_seq1:459-2774(+)
MLRGHDVSTVLEERHGRSLRQNEDGQLSRQRGQRGHAARLRGAALLAAQVGGGARLGEGRWHGVVAWRGKAHQWGEESEMPTPKFLAARLAPRGRKPVGLDGHDLGLADGVDRQRQGLPRVHAQQPRGADLGHARPPATRSGAARWRRGQNRCRGAGVQRVAAAKHNLEQRPRTVILAVQGDEREHHAAAALHLRDDAVVRVQLQPQLDGRVERAQQQRDGGRLCQPRRVDNKARELVAVLERRAAAADLDRRHHKRQRGLLGDRSRPPRAGSLFRLPGRHLELREVAAGEHAEAPSRCRQGRADQALSKHRVAMLVRHQHGCHTLAATRPIQLGIRVVVKQPQGNGGRRRVRVAADGHVQAQRDRHGRRDAKPVLEQHDMLARLLGLQPAEKVADRAPVALVAGVREQADDIRALLRDGNHQPVCKQGRVRLRGQPRCADDCLERDGTLAAQLVCCNPGAQAAEDALDDGRSLGARVQMPPALALVAGHGLLAGPLRALDGAHHSEQAHARHVQVHRPCLCESLDADHRTCDGCLPSGANDARNSMQDGVPELQKRAARDAKLVVGGSNMAERLDGLRRTLTNEQVEHADDGLEVGHKPNSTTTKLAQHSNLLRQHKVLDSHDAQDVGLRRGNQHTQRVAPGGQAQAHRPRAPRGHVHDSLAGRGRFPIELLQDQSADYGEKARIRLACAARVACQHKGHRVVRPMLAPTSLLPSIAKHCKHYKDCTPPAPGVPLLRAAGSVATVNETTISMWRVALTYSIHGCPRDMST